MYKSIFIILSILSLWAPSAKALLDLQLSAWYAELDGDLSDGTNIDLRDDLGFEESTEAISGALAVGIHHQVYADFLSFGMNGSRRLPEALEFDGRSLSSGTEIDTSLDISELSGAYRFEAGSDILRFGFMVGIQQWEFDLGINPATSFKLAADTSATIPYVGGFVSGHPLPFIDFKASVMSGRLNIGSEDASSLRAELGLLLEIPPGFYIGAGYRHIQIKNNSGAFDIDAEMAGPIVFIGFRL